MHITFHCEERVNQRSRFNGKTAQRFVENAFKRGKRADNFTSMEASYLRHFERNGLQAYVYSGYLLLANGDRCVTIFELPNWFGKKSKQTQKTTRSNEFER